MKNVAEEDDVDEQQLLMYSLRACFHNQAPSLSPFRAHVSCQRVSSVANTDKRANCVGKFEFCCCVAFAHTSTWKWAGDILGRQRRKRHDLFLFLLSSHWLVGGWMSLP